MEIWMIALAWSHLLEPSCSVAVNTQGLLGIVTGTGKQEEKSFASYRSRQVDRVGGLGVDAPLNGDGRGALNASYSSFSSEA